MIEVGLALNQFLDHDVVDVRAFTLYGGVRQEQEREPDLPIADDRRPGVQCHLAHVDGDVLPTAGLARDAVSVEIDIVDRPHPEHLIAWVVGVAAGVDVGPEVEVPRPVDRVGQRERAGDHERALVRGVLGAGCLRRRPPRGAPRGASPI